MNHYSARQHSQRTGLDTRASLPLTYWSTLRQGIFPSPVSPWLKNKHNGALSAWTEHTRVLSRPTC